MFFYTVIALLNEVYSIIFNQFFFNLFRWLF